MGTFIDRTGMRFGRLLALKRVENMVAPSGLSMAMYECRCDCGHTSIVLGGHLANGRTRSCGCLARELTQERNRRGKRHGLSGTRTYRSFLAAKKRCMDPNDRQWSYYGGRGIKFLIPSVEALVAAIGECPPGLSLNRINNDGHYEIGNVEWADSKKQNNNRRSNVLITSNGRAQTAAQWADELFAELGVSSAAMCNRVRRGWTVEDILTTPAGIRRNCKLSKKDIQTLLANDEHQDVTEISAIIASLQIRPGSTIGGKIELQ
jgi:hypothetical protein